MSNTPEGKSPGAGARNQFHHARDLLGGDFTTGAPPLALYPRRPHLRRCRARARGGGRSCAGVAAPPALPAKTMPPYAAMRPHALLLARSGGAQL